MGFADRVGIMFQKPTVADLRQAAQKLGMNPATVQISGMWSLPPLSH